VLTTPAFIVSISKDPETGLGTYASGGSGGGCEANIYTQEQDCGGKGYPGQS
jgi:hypothetical protein